MRDVVLQISPSIKCGKNKDMSIDFGRSTLSQVKSSHVTFIYIALLTIQIVTALHNIKIGKLCQ